ncbi:ParB/RepB/Spo0J family partition protein [Variovorax terrae]|uniref:ParB/RepB/Spo0J family partition protein n=1 Tax=Variovorax terrae TaxID=2923278 RepID=A0A9X2ASG7_9BURK|nr:ParB/RepB/Spo0J family partition protein [Variovorax terrae]MCJ0765336.1 ParB/RepB/Spo0J family partition protein [Variovorax terrae]
MSALTIKMIHPSAIAAPSFVRQQNGHDKEGLSQLAASIKQHGLLQPIVVRPATEDEAPAQWTVIAGRRRLAACKMAGMTELPAIVAETDEARSYEMEIAENIQREQMTLADTARAVRTLMTIYNNQKKVCEVLNKSAAWVSKHLSVTASNCPRVVQEMLDQGIVKDLETLMLLKAIASMPASHPGAMNAMARMMRIAQEGNMNRQIAQDALAKLRAPTPIATTTTTTGATTTTTKQLDMLEDKQPATTFTLELPISYLEKIEAMGGMEWLLNLIDSNQH